MQHFANLNVWKRSHALVLDLYRLSAGFPADERFGLTSQIRRAAASVPTNIAEGSKRKSQRDYAHFLNLAEASLAETDYLILLSRDLTYLTTDQAEPLQQEVSEISRMLYALREKVDGPTSAS